MVLTLVSACLLLIKISNADQDFSYEGAHGPAHWGEAYDTCIGKHQSPINIEEHYVKNVSLPPLTFSGLGIPRASFLTNTGHTVMLKTNESRAAMVTGGPLGDRVYVFEQLHFHWGENDTQGSEDLINNHSFAMELHAVFYKREYGSMEAAVQHPDGLAVLAYFYDACAKPNPTYEAIVDVLPNLEEVGRNDRLKEPLLLEKLLVPNSETTQDYFTYNGSLTTPPCSEVVTWIDFKDPQLLSTKQLDAFRNVRTTDGRKLTHNFRPVQPLEDRVIFRNVRTGSDIPKVPHSGQIGISLSVLVLLAAILFAV